MKVQEECESPEVFVEDEAIEVISSTTRVRVIEGCSGETVIKGSPDVITIEVGGCGGDPSPVNSVNIGAIESSDVSEIMLPANPHRVGLELYHKSEVPGSWAYVAYKDVATDLIFTDRLGPGSSFTMTGKPYKGPISVIFDSEIDGTQLNYTELLS